MGAFSPIHFLILAFVVLLPLGIFLTALIILLSNAKTRLVTSLVLVVPLVLLLLVGCFVMIGSVAVPHVRIDESVSRQVVARDAKSQAATAEYNAAKTLADLGKRDQAIAHYQKALQLKPDDAEAHYGLGKALADRGKRDEALAHYRKALQLKPDYADARDSLDRLVQQQGTKKNVATEVKKLAAKPAATPPAEAAEDTKAKGEDTKKDARPAWVDAKPQLVDDVYQMAVSVGPYTSLLECDAKLPEAIRRAVDEYTELALGPEVAGTAWLPDDSFCRQLIKDRWEEIKPFSVGPMTQLHVLLQFDRKAKDRLADAYRQGVIEQRLWLTVLGTAAFLSLLAVLYGYLKLTAIRAVKPQP